MEHAAADAGPPAASAGVFNCNWEFATGVPDGMPSPAASPTPASSGSSIMSALEGLSGFDFKAALTRLEDFNDSHSTPYSCGSSAGSISGGADGTAGSPVALQSTCGHDTLLNFSLGRPERSLATLPGLSPGLLQGQPRSAAGAGTTERTGEPPACALQRIQGLERQLAEREVQLAEKEEQVAQKDEQLAERDEQLACVQQKLADSEQRYNDLHQRYSELEQRYSQVVQELAAAQQGGMAVPAAAGSEPQAQQDGAAVQAAAGPEPGAQPGGLPKFYETAAPLSTELVLAQLAPPLAGFDPLRINDTALPASKLSEPLHLDRAVELLNSATQNAKGEGLLAPGTKEGEVRAGAWQQEAVQFKDWPSQRLEARMLQLSAGGTTKTLRLLGVPVPRHKKRPAVVWKFLSMADVRAVEADAAAVKAWNKALDALAGAGSGADKLLAALAKHGGTAVFSSLAMKD
ncbi:hypothetical protein ABPG75_006772 [Micractinium tetrahymenae]